MLVLSRKQNDSLVIGDDIRVTVVQVKGNKVRLGIEAPAHVNILRSELVFDLEKFETRSGKTASQDSKNVTQVA